MVNAYGNGMSKTVRHAIHIHTAGQKFHVMILIDGIYEEYLYNSWQEVFDAHPICLGYSKDVHIFVR